MFVMVLDGVEDRPLAKSSSSTRKVFFLDVALGFGSIVMCKQEKDEQRVFTKPEE